MKVPGVDTSTPIGDVVTGGSVIRWRLENKLGRSKVRGLWTVTGAGFRNRYGVHNASKSNLLRGMYERVLYRVVDGEAHLPPTPVGNVFEERLTWFREALCAVMPLCLPVTRQQFVAMYHGRKASIYQRACVSLASRPLCVSDSFLSTFLKCEKIDFFHKPDPAPRVIQPRSPRYNVEVGRYLKPLEKRLCKGIAEIWGGHTVLKGLNARGVAGAIRDMWEQFDDPVAIGIDATRFDQHVSADALRFEHSVYCSLFPEHTRPKLAKMLEWQITNRGYARLDDLDLMYEVEGRRMSGDMNTGMGNCLLMCAMMHWICKKCNIKARLANNGDDCVLVMNKSDLKRLHGLNQYALDFGFVLEVEEPVYVLEEISFCQNHPVFDGSEWVMVRDPRKCIDKDLVTVLDLGSKKGAQKWAHAIGSGGVALSGGIPVLDSFYRMLLRSGVAGDVGNHPWLDNGFAMMARGMDRDTRKITDQARLSFWRAFSITPDQQTSIEEHYIASSLNLSAGVSISPIANYRELWK